MSDTVKVSDPTAVTVSDRMEELVLSVSQAAFACGRWRKDDPEPYVDVRACLQASNDKLLREIGWLETVIDQWGKRIQELEAHQQETGMRLVDQTSRHTSGSPSPFRTDPAGEQGYTTDQLDAARADHLRAVIQPVTDPAIGAALAQADITQEPRDPAGETPTLSASPVWGDAVVNVACGRTFRMGPCVIQKTLEIHAVHCDPEERTHAAHRAEQEILAALDPTEQESGDKQSLTTTNPNFSSTSLGEVCRPQTPGEEIPEYVTRFVEQARRLVGDDPLELRADAMLWLAKERDRLLDEQIDEVEFKHYVAEAERLWEENSRLLTALEDTEVHVQELKNALQVALNERDFYKSGRDTLASKNEALQSASVLQKEALDRMKGQLSKHHAEQRKWFAPSGACATCGEVPQ